MTRAEIEAAIDRAKVSAAPLEVRTARINELQRLLNAADESCIVHGDLDGAENGTFRMMESEG